MLHHHVHVSSRHSSLRGLQQSPQAQLHGICIVAGPHTSSYRIARCEISARPLNRTWQDIRILLRCLRELRSLARKLHRRCQGSRRSTGPSRLVQSGDAIVVRARRAARLAVLAAGNIGVPNGRRALDLMCGRHK